MSDVGKLSVKLECDADEFLAKCNAARAALEALTKAANEAQAAVAAFASSKDDVITVTDVRKPMRSRPIVS
ncbi:hypothetical protein GCM10007908_03560 [Rhizobium albus]|nr:hypothetical protein GCM10007908_03560 [Rhizobium albus]